MQIQATRDYTQMIQVLATNLTNEQVNEFMIAG
jgi:hypothetical protein